MARMVCKRAFFPAAVNERQSPTEVPAFEDWRSASAGSTTSPTAAHLAICDGGWFQSSRELSAGLGFSEGPWLDGPFGDPGSGEL
jgi:hypothetical protein